MNINEQNKTGEIVCVGIGMKLGAHITPIARSYIENADVVFSMQSNGLVERWVAEMNPDVRSLQSFYEVGKSRHITYREMIEAMMTEVRAGKRVVGAFYGHPGVFAYAPHKVIEIARGEGFAAHMEPGVSAEDCLIADLNIDPGKYGCQQFETSQFMYYWRQIDPSAYLILWQIGAAGDKSLTQYVTTNAYRQLLVKRLLEFYPPEHQVILYEAAVLPIDKVRAEHVPLSELASCEVFQHTTLVIPPGEKMRENKELLDELARLK